MLLEEVEGDRRLPIWVGEFEGIALAMSLERVELPRPGPYRFAASLLGSAGGALREVRVTRLAEGTFYAEAIVDGPSGREQLDARPSDVLNLALVVGAPIRVDPALLDDPSIRTPSPWGDRVQDLQEGPAEIVAERQAEWERTMAAWASAREQGGC